MTIAQAYEAKMKHYQELHAIYCAESGLKRPWTNNCDYIWAQWERTSKEFTPEALRLVIRWIKQEVRLGRLWNNRLRFEDLIGNPDKFADHLSQALAEQDKIADRKAKAARAMEPGRAEILEASGREPTEGTSANVQTSAQAIERTKLAESLKEWRAKNL